MTLHLGYTVDDYDFETTRFCVKSRDKAEEGERWIEADVILAADGVKSKARTKMLARMGEVDSGGSGWYPMLLRQMADSFPLQWLILARLRIGFW